MVLSGAIQQHELPGSTQGRICCLLADEADKRNEDIFKRNIWALTLCMPCAYNVYFARKIKKYLHGHCPNMRLSCIGKYPRNAMSYKASATPTTNPTQGFRMFMKIYVFFFKKINVCLK